MTSYKPSSHFHPFHFYSRHTTCLREEASSKHVLHPSPPCFILLVSPSSQRIKRRLAFSNSSVIYILSHSDSLLHSKCLLSFHTHGTNPCPFLLKQCRCSCIVYITRCKLTEVLFSLFLSIRHRHLTAAQTWLHAVLRFIYVDVRKRYTEYLYMERKPQILTWVKKSVHLSVRGK
jgi:hypothetical protein